MMQNVFYFTSKALFVLKIFKFSSWLFCHVAKQLDLKDKVNSEFYDATSRLTNIVINILRNILRSKRNQTMKFGQIIEYNMRNTFLEKSYTKCGGETSPWPSSGRLKLSRSRDQ